MVDCFALGACPLGDDPQLVVGHVGQTDLRCGESTPTTSQTEDIVDHCYCPFGEEDPRQHADRHLLAVE
jgi:hypothetical protein